MPELPEVETTLQGISPHAKGFTVSKVIVRNRSMRWPVPDHLENTLRDKKLNDIYRRGKYLLFSFSHGTVILHLGMSGSLRVMPHESTPQKHDHIDICFGSNCLRFNDPRRFGCVLWTADDIQYHPLIEHLGPEPLTDIFNADYIYPLTRKRKQCIKAFIMDSKIVVGVGNIYANEALFLSGIHPLKAAGKVSKLQIEQLVKNIKLVLSHAIQRGGTTLRDFVGSDGQPGYFYTCKKILTEKRVSQRSTVYCTQCQT